MTYTEEATLFACAGDTLSGILALPDTPADTAVVVVVGGPQYRAGSHRQFVLLSRALASAGLAVLRFDYRGMGDSTGTQRDFEAVSPDIAAAINTMQHLLPNINRIILWGLCDAAAAALLYCHETQDARVTGLCLLNPWVRSEASLARTQVKHYYMRRIMQKQFWLKLLRGGVATRALSGLLQNIRVALNLSTSSTLDQASQKPFQDRMAHAWMTFPGHILLLLSGDDYTAKEFLEYTRSDPTWKNSQRHSKLMRSDIPGADHTFSNAISRKRVEDLTVNWMAHCD